MAAEEASRRSNATLVIWGEYDSGRVIARFTGPTGGSERDRQVVDLTSSPSDLPTTINVGLTGEVRHVALLTLGQLYLERDEFDRAKSVFVRAMDPATSDAAALANLRFQLGRAYMGGEFIDLDEAIWLFNQVLNVQPQSVEVLNNRAVAFLDRGRPGDFDLAIDDLLRAASIKPDRAATSLNLAVAYLDRGGEGDAERALASLNAALAAEPDYAAALVNRAGAYLARGTSGDLDRAFDDLDQALEIEPDLASAHLNRAIVYLARGSAGDLELAVEELGRAITLDPDSSAAYFNRGLVHSELKNWSESVADSAPCPGVEPSPAGVQRSAVSAVVRDWRSGGGAALLRAGGGSPAGGSRRRWQRSRQRPLGPDRAGHRRLRSVPRVGGGFVGRCVRPPLQPHPGVVGRGSQSRRESVRRSHASGATPKARASRRRALLVRVRPGPQRGEPQRVDDADGRNRGEHQREAPVALDAALSDQHGEDDVGDYRGGQERRDG